MTAYASHTGECFRRRRLAGIAPLRVRIAHFAFHYGSATVAIAWAGAPLLVRGRA